MIRLQSIGKDGSHDRAVWLNPAHIIGVESDDGVTCVTTSGPAQLFVAESVERVVELMTAAK